jgi:tripartite-type tricarboxylate transporter receptor subunit TctC
LTGSKAIRDAAPDGRTVGLVNGGGLVMARLVEGDKVPDLARDYTILGRLGRQTHVWVTVADSALATVADLERPGGQPVVFGIQDVGSGSFVASALGSHVLGLPVSFVAGYRGSQETALAVMRGEVELASAPFESLLDQIEAGDLRPLLQISERPVADHPSLAGVPTLVELAAEQAARDGRPADTARQDAKAVADITDTGRFVVAPSGLEPGLAACLDAAVAAAVADPGFTAAAAAARRSLDVLGGAEATRHAQEVAARAAAFRAILAESVRLVRS